MNSVKYYGESVTGLNDVTESVECFVHLRNKFNVAGGCLSAVTARVLVGWMKLRELSEGIVWKETVSENERGHIRYA